MLSKGVQQGFKPVIKLDASEHHGQNALFASSLFPSGRNGGNNLFSFEQEQAKKRKSQRHERRRAFSHANGPWHPGKGVLQLLALKHQGLPINFTPRQKFLFVTQREMSLRVLQPFPVLLHFVNRFRKRQATPFQARFGFRKSHHRTQQVKHTKSSGH